MYNFSQGAVNPSPTQPSGRMVRSADGAEDVLSDKPAVTSQLELVDERAYSSILERYRRDESRRRNGRLFFPTFITTVKAVVTSTVYSTSGTASLSVEATSCASGVVLSSYIPLCG